MIVRQAQPGDLPEIMEIERQSPAAHWSDQEYQRLFAASPEQAPRLCLVVESTGIERRIAGFVIAGCAMADEWEIENIAIAQGSQRAGLGTRLIQELQQMAESAGVSRIHLEVRESNVAARALYRRAGFVESGRRKSYYTAPEEDAILLSYAVKRS
jgi:ribosomal-protein-alanine N-acetyltransferase